MRGAAFAEPAFARETLAMSMIHRKFFSNLFNIEQTEMLRQRKLCFLLCVLSAALASNQGLVSEPIASCNYRECLSTEVIRED